MIGDGRVRDCGRGGGRELNGRRKDGAAGGPLKHASVQPGRAGELQGHNSPGKLARDFPGKLARAARIIENKGAAPPNRADRHKEGEGVRDATRPT